MDAEHMFRFRSQSCVFKFIRHSVDEALIILRISASNVFIKEKLYICTRSFWVFSKTVKQKFSMNKLENSKTNFAIHQLF